MTLPVVRLLEEILPDEAECSRLANLRDRIEEVWQPYFSLHLEKHKLPYESQPYLFLAAFPQLRHRHLAELSLALRFCLCATLLTDKVIDHPKDTGNLTRDVLRIQAIQFECFHILYKLFPAGTKFWQRFRACLTGFTQACLEERRFIDGEHPWESYTQERAMSIARGKNSLARLIAAGLVELAGDDLEYPRFSESIEKHYCAWQIWDDLCDWKDDFRGGVPSLLLTRIISQLPDTDSRERLIPILARKIYYDGHALHTLDQAISLLDEADQLVADISDLAWRSVIFKLRAECVALREDICRIVEKNLGRVREQRPFELGSPTPRTNGNSLTDISWSALSFLIDQWRLGFGEAQHVMYLTREQGYTGSTEFPSGDVFQRALIADALCDVDERLGGRLRPVIEHEVRYLLSQRSESGVGGWRYLPTVPEMAPDADDLGQVMQVLLRAGFRPAVEDHCERPLAVILEDARRHGGPFDTWIIPAQNRGALEETQVKLRSDNWGPGPDSEVMANLLYALVLYDRKRFASMVDQGVNFIEGRQESDGSWHCKWYFGPFYGTYVCLRVLAAARPNSPAIPTARDFLLGQQRGDGGWGYWEESDPLSTALALLGLSVGLAEAASGPHEWAVRGVRYLEQARESDGGWPGVPFLSLPPYSSRTITTMYVLKACLACQARSSSTRDESEGMATYAGALLPRGDSQRSGHLD